jgi:hypothetical protein
MWWLVRYVEGLRVEVEGKDRVGEQFLWPAEVCGGEGVEGGGESGRGVRKGTGGSDNGWMVMLFLGRAPRSLGVVVDVAAGESWLTGCICVSASSLLAIRSGSLQKSLQVVASRGVEQWLVDGFCDRSGTKVGRGFWLFERAGKSTVRREGVWRLAMSLVEESRLCLFVCVAGCQAECHYASFDVFLGAVCR